MKRIITLLAIFSLQGYYLSAYCQTGNKDVLNKLRTFSAVHLTEKAYLHFDKPYYATGDTIYFKAYVTMGERLDLSQISGVLHVDLINTANKADQSIKLQLVNGLAWGDFALPDSLPAGNYRIRAYTQWMRNGGNYFEKTILVGSVHNNRVPESNTAKPVTSKPELQFFPEGGQFVAGIPAKVAFKAIGSNGLGMAAKGVVTDNAGKEVVSFASAHLGMGFFLFTPEDGMSYKASITFADGSHNMLDLPVAEVKGIGLSVNNDSLAKTTVKIQANKVFFDENKGKDYTLLIYSGGLATTVPVKLDSAMISLDIIKRHLHTGITRITLFSATNEPLAERLMFVQNYDQLNLHIGTDKIGYIARQKVNVRLNVKNRADSAVIGHFSISVIDESKVSIEENTENTILTDLLLTSDLKGTVEQPNYYFINISEEKLRDLDLVMLTHGYRKFEWKQVLSENESPLAWQPEKSLQISGVAKNLFGKPLAKASVSLLSFQQHHFISTIADDRGNFKFDNLAFTDTANFILQAVKAKGGKYTKLTYDQDTLSPVKVMPEQMLPDRLNPAIPAGCLENRKKQEEELRKLNFGKNKMLREVEIKGKRSDIVEINPRYGVPDKIITAKQIGYGGQLSLKLLSLFHRPGYHSKAYLIVIDGIEMPKNFNIDQLNSGSIKTLEVFQNTIGPDYEGVLSFTTNPGQQPSDMVSTGFLPIKVIGYCKAREFYSPKYESNATNIHPDLRSTIYWKPELLTDQEGHASFDFYNADGAGTYRVVVEGMDEKGNIGRQVYRYKVE